MHKAVKMSCEATGNCLPGRPAFFITVPIKPDDRFRESYYVTQLIKCVDHNKKLPANLTGKIHCNTVESIKTKLSGAVFARWQQTAKPVKGGNQEKCT